MARTESAAEVCLPKGALLIGESRLETASGGKCAHVNPATGRAQAWLPLVGPKETRCRRCRRSRGSAPLADPHSER